MAVSVRLEPMLEKELELTVKRLGITKSQFIISALERALKHKNSYELFIKVHDDVRDSEVAIRHGYVPPPKNPLREKLKAKHEASQSDWLAFHAAKKSGQSWTGDETDRANNT